MKVQVTRDAAGVQIWKEGVKLDYTKGIKSIPRLDGNANIIEPLPETEFGKSPKWINVKISWGRKFKVFSDKFVVKNFPELEKNLKIGEHKIMDLSIF